MPYIKALLLFSTLCLLPLSADINISNKFDQIISNLTDSNNLNEDKLTTPSSKAREERRLKIEESLRQIEALKNKQKLTEKEKAKQEKELIEEAKRIELERFLEEQKEQKEQLLKVKLSDDLKKLDEYFKKDNQWSTVYANYKTYQELELRLEAINKRIDILSKKTKQSEKDKDALRKYKEQLATTEGKLAQLQEYKKEEPFEELLKPIPIGEVPSVTSPLDIIKAFSFQKHLKAVQEDYIKRKNSLEEAIRKLMEKQAILNRLTKLNTALDYTSQQKMTAEELRIFRSKLDIIQTRQRVLEQEITGLNHAINESIAKEVDKAITIGTIVLFAFLIFFLIKYLVRKYMLENELFYTTNKAINITFMTILFFVLLFSYLENVGHLVTILSFASAGIAIALKDWFMNIMGWLVIIFSGSIHVGDRIRVSRDGNEYVGDVVDISLLRMTLHEDVTLTTYTTNRRAGRILFIPNNYIFTEMIANYSHSGLKTVWDGIDFIITFDSDALKAQSIAKEVSRKYSKGYTDMTRKQLNKLRSKYSMRNTSVEPRIFAFFDEHGIRISVWYLTNAYATLTLRSTISMEILSQIKEEESISIAFPSQSLYINKAAPTLPRSKDNKKSSDNNIAKKSADKYKPDDWGIY